MMPTSWKPIAAYFLLALILLGLVPLLSLATDLTMDFDAAGAAAAEETGMEMTSNLLVLVRLAIVEPALWLLILGAAVPSLAAILVCLASGKPTISGLLGRLHPLGPNRGPWTRAVFTYGLVFLLAPLSLASIWLLRDIMPGSHEYTRPDGLLGWGIVLALLTAAFLDQGGLLEELGWRGYGQPAIQTHLTTPLAAAIILGVAWGLWHVPRDVVGGTIERLGVVMYLSLFLPSFVLGTVVNSVVFAYFCNRAGGSVWPAIMLHGLANDAVGISGSAPITVALTPYHQITKAAPMLVIALMIVAITGNQLGRTSSTT